jgi:polysaccharide deacetylase family protein (PEP-CTERM system associated)
MITNALSVDVEEYYHGMEFEAAVLPEQRKHLPSRIETNVERMLDLFAAHKLQATFFTVGQVAGAHPQMIRRISAANHEIACHSHCHELVWRQTPDQFRSDIRRAKTLLEDLSGKPVIGYRAPNYSIRHGQDWAYDILLEEGFRYDSSVYPILHDRYGFPHAPRFPYQIRSNGHGHLIEFPIGTVQFLGINFPIGGGGYFRLLPLLLTRYGVHRVNAREQKPVMFYMHPWELDPDQPRPSMPWHHRFRHYVGLRREEAKLSRLFEQFRFGTVQDVLELSRVARLPSPVKAHFLP